MSVANTAAASDRDTAIPSNQTVSLALLAVAIAVWFATNMPTWGHEPLRI